MTNNSQNSYPADRDSAGRHLAYLGYESGESVYLRFFYHGSDPRKHNDAGRKENRLDWEQVEKYQSEGRGAYVVVNGSGGGHADGDIDRCCAIFCEWDDLPLEEQLQKWEEIGFVEPTFVVYSGDKSMQPYWVFSEPVGVEQWRELQELLIAVMGADPSNKNPSRVFRLAGGWHVKPGREPVKSEIVRDSGIRYSCGELCDRLLELQPLQPKQLPPPAPKERPALPESGIPRRYKDVRVPVPVPVPLTCALGKTKEFLDGVSNLRNTSMASLARDLLGTANEFERLGQTTDGDPYQLFIDACHRCSPGGGWGEREWEQIWRSAARSHPDSSLNHKISPDAVENCIKGWYWRFLGNGSSKTPSRATAPGDDLELTDDEASCKLIRDYRKLCSVFGNRIRLNSLTKRIEIDGQPISLDRAKLQLAIKYGAVLKSGREDVQDMISELAETNQYSPVAEYLLSLPVPTDTSILDGLARRYLGTAEPIYSSMVRKTLIAAVARALKPGCKVDTALIFQSPQGWKKSMFFNILAGDWFDDSFGAMSDKDERLKLHSAWILEWAELETVFKRKDVAATKAFLSCASDSIRPPYGRETVKMPRPSIVVGSTNEHEFLSDTTGNRRFWVVPVKQRIDGTQLATERNAIWAAAVLAYHSGERWWLDSDEERVAEALVEEFQTQDPWHDPIAEFVARKEWVAVTSVLDHLQVDLSRQERAHQMRVAGVLKSLGWSKTIRTVSGKRTRIWICPLPPPELPPPPPPDGSDRPPGLPLQPLHGVVPQVDRLQNPAAISIQPAITTCNYLFTKNMQKEGEDSSQASSSRDETNISLKFGEKGRSGSSGSSNPDIASFDLETLPTPGGSDLPEGSNGNAAGGRSLGGASSLYSPLEGRSPAPSKGRSLGAAESVEETLALSDRTVTELVGFARQAVAGGDAELANQIQSALKEVCDSGAADRKEVWLQLTKQEQTAFTALLQPKPQPEALVDPADAQQIREIALMWWDELPEQSLLTQLAGHIRKYGNSAIAGWLPAEPDDLVRQRIAELLKRLS